MDIKHKILSLLVAFFSKEVVILFVAALPIFELRLSMPLGIIKYHMPVWYVFILSFAGNMLPVVPLLIFYKYFFCKLQDAHGVTGRFFRWWFAKVERKSKGIERFGFWGLVFFVGVPLPGTGAWTGAAAATLLKMDIKKAFLAITVGVAMAGIIMLILSVVALDLLQTWITF